MRPWSPSEPARQKPYRKFYWRTKHQFELIEDRLDYLLDYIDELKKRVDELEHKKKTDDEAT